MVVESDCFGILLSFKINAMKIYHQILATIIIMITATLSQVTCQDLYPAYTSEITYKEGVAYFQGSRFTGIIVAEKTNKRLCECRNGYKEGQCVELYPNGKKRSDAFYKNGNVEGLYSEWYESGVKKVETQYTEGRANGLHQVWSDDGSKKLSANYKGGKKDGAWVEYYPNGSVKTSLFFIQDKANGTSVLYYENGQKKMETVFVAGTESGAHSEYYENGSERIIYQYSQGKIEDGTYTERTSSGEKLKLQTYKSGILQKESIYRNGSIYEHTLAYYPDSENRKSEGVLKDGLRDSLWTDWFENGQVSVKAYYESNQLHGKCEEWYSNGEKKKEAIYTHGELTTLIFENLVDPSSTVQVRMKAEGYLFKVEANKSDKVVCVMVVFRYSNTEQNKLLRQNILNSLEGRFDMVPKSDWSKYYSIELRNSIEFTEPSYTTIYDDGKSTISLGGVPLLNTQVTPGYRGKANFDVNVYDLNTMKLLNKYSFGPVTNQIYPDQQAARAKAALVPMGGVERLMTLAFRPKVTIQKIVESDKKGKAKLVMINHGNDVGLAKNYTFLVYLATNQTQSLGVLEVEEASEDLAICRVVEGEEAITSHLIRGNKLIAILTENVPIK